MGSTNESISLRGASPLVRAENRSCHGAELGQSPALSIVGHDVGLVLELHGNTGGNVPSYHPRIDPENLL